MLAGLVFFVLSSPFGLNSEEVVGGRGRWIAGAGRWRVSSGAVVCAEELLVASLVGISLSQNSRELTL